MKLTEEESLFCQALATTSLLAELSNQKFLESDYYKNLKFESNDELFKYILKKSGLGNPTTMQMFLYILLVVPKEMLNRIDDQTMEKWQNEINNLCVNLVEKETFSTYEEDKNQN